MSELTLSHEVVEGVCYITAAGVLDAHTASNLDDLIGKVAKKGCAKVVCTLEEITYIASAGVGVFLGYVSQLKDEGGGLVLIYAREVDAREGKTGLAQGYNVFDVFNLLGLGELIEVVRNREDAAALLN